MMKVVKIDNNWFKELKNCTEENVLLCFDKESRVQEEQAEKICLKSLYVTGEEGVYSRTMLNVLKSIDVEELHFDNSHIPGNLKNVKTKKMSITYGKMNHGKNTTSIGGKIYGVVDIPVLPTSLEELNIYASNSTLVNYVADSYRDNTNLTRFAVLHFVHECNGEKNKKKFVDNHRNFTEYIKNNANKQ